MQLTPEQQDRINNSIWVVNTALKAQGLSSNEDLRQSAILYMCKCISRYDESKGVKWTTYAYKNVYLYIKNQHSKEVVRQNNILPIDLFDIDERVLGEVDNALVKPIINNVMSILNPIEKQILTYKLQGYKSREIGELLNCSENKINNYIQKIKDKVR